MDPVVNQNRWGRQSATLGMGWRMLSLARATARARWTLSVTRYMPNLLTEGVSNRRAQDFVHCVAVSHDGRWVVSGSGDHGVRFWDAKSGVVQLMLKGHNSSGLLSPSHSERLGLIVLSFQSSQLISAPPEAFWRLVQSIGRSISVSLATLQNFH